MKITKDYLRQLIRESLEEGGDFTPATLPYEVGQEEAEVDDGLTRATPEMALNKIIQVLNSDKKLETKLHLIGIALDAYRRK